MNLSRSLTWTLRLALAVVLLPACSAPPSRPKAEPPAAKAEQPPPSPPPAAPDRVAIRAQLAEHRAAQMAHLHSYGEMQQFPYDPITASPHTFRDPEGRLCAVASLIETDGHHELVEAVVRDNNALAIVDVHSGPVMDWILTSGFTREELERIQVWPPYPRRRVRKIQSKVTLAEQRMKAQVVKHIAEMEVELTRDTEKSLDIALERYLAAYAKAS